MLLQLPSSQIKNIITNCINVMRTDNYNSNSDREACLDTLTYIFTNISKPELKSLFQNDIEWRGQLIGKLKNSSMRIEHHDKNFHDIFGGQQKIEELVINKILEYSISDVMEYNKFEQEMDHALDKRISNLVIDLFINSEHIEKYLTRKNLFNNDRDESVQKKEKLLTSIIVHECNNDYKDKILKILLKQNIDAEEIKSIFEYIVVGSIYGLKFNNMMQLVLEGEHLNFQNLNKEGLFFEQIALNSYKKEQVEHLHEFLQGLRNEEEQIKAKAYYLLSKQFNSEEVIPELLDESTLSNKKLVTYLENKKNIHPKGHDGVKLFELFKSCSKNKEIRNKLFQTKETILFWQLYFLPIISLSYIQKNKKKEQQLFNELFGEDNDFKIIKNAIIKSLNLEYADYSEVNKKEQKTDKVVFINNPASLALSPLPNEDELKEIKYSELMPMFNSLKSLAFIDKKIVIERDSSLDYLIEALQFFTIDKENLSEKDGNLIFQGVYQLLKMRKEYLSDDALIIIENLQKNFKKLTLEDMPLEELPKEFENKINEIILNNSLIKNRPSSIKQDRF